MSALRIGSLFSGYGGLDMGVQAVIGGRVVWHVEFDPAPSRILAHHYPDVPNHGDITAVDWTSVEPVDILTGGFPCQDVSLAGLRRGLKEGTRSGLWSEFARAIDVLRPSLVVIENVRGLLSAEATGVVESDAWGLGDGGSRPTLRALGAVLGDLAELGYDAVWCGVRAADAGAPHGRFRVFVLAYPGGDGCVELGQAHDDDGSRAFGDESHRLGAAAADADDGDRHGRERSTWGDSRARTVAAGSGDDAATDPGRDDAGRREAGDMACSSGAGEGDQGERERDGAAVGDRGAADTAWGAYGPAIDRWQRVLGRVAPAPTRPDGRDGSHRLNPVFVEWMMGLPEGHVTGVGLTRNQELTALGNGVVPQQAALAVRHLMAVPA